jgi:hypothetical protein
MSLGVSGLATILSGRGVFSMHAKIRIASTTTGANDNNILVANINGATIGAVLNVDGTAGAPKVRISARSVNTDGRQVKSGATTIGVGVDAYVGGIVNIAGDTIEVYLNGVSDGSVGVTFANATWTLGTPTGADTVGGYLAPPSATADQFDGQISEIAVWSSALSGANFATLAGGTPASSVSAGTLVYYLPIAGTTSPEPPTVGAPSGTITGSLPAPPPPPTIAVPTTLVEVELAGAGAGWTSISADVVREEGVHLTIGMTGGGPIDRVASSGLGSFTLRNDAKNSASLLGYYSLYHANKRTGWALGIGCRIRFTDPNTSTPYTRLVGRIDAIDPVPGLFGQRRVHVTVADWMDEAARWNLTPDVGEQVGKRWDEIGAAILAEMPRQPTATSWDRGGDSYSYALDTSTNTQQPALSEFANLANSEIGLIYQKADGTLRGEGRHTRLLNTTTAWTITDADLQGLTMRSSRDDIINTVRVTLHPKTVDDLPDTIVYDQANVIEVAPGATKFLLGSYRDPLTGDPIGATDIQPQIPIDDYTANTSSDGTGTDITSDFALVVTAGAAGARFAVTDNNAEVGFLTFNQLQGRGIYDRGAVQLEATDATSIALNGEHVVTFDMPYQDISDTGQGAANYFLAKYATASALVQTATVVADTGTLLAQVLTRDISDRITISETVTGVNAPFFINGIDLRQMPSGHLEATYILAPAADPFAGLYWILGTSVLGTNTIPAPF